jgi:hypothetical protein
MLESLASGMPNPNAARLVASGGGIVDFKMGPDGYVYFSDYRGEVLLAEREKLWVPTTKV